MGWFDFDGVVLDKMCGGGAGQNVGANVDGQATKKTLRKFIRKYIKGKPLRGSDQVGNQRLVITKPVQGLYDDYLRKSQELTGGGVMVIQEEWGAGKTFSSQIVARARTAKQPPRFLIVSTKGSTANGDDWYKKVTQLLRVSANTDPADLADALKHELCFPSQPYETNDQWRVDVEGLDANMIHSHRGGFPVLILEDLKVNWKSIALTEKESKLNNEAKQELVLDKLGGAGDFVYHLAQHFYKCGIVIVTTDNKDIAFALHYAVNSGKCMFAKSLVAAHSLKKFPNEIDESDYVGFGWDNTSKVDFLMRLFADVDDKIIKDVVSAAKGKDSIRDIISDIVDLVPTAQYASTIKSNLKHAATESTDSVDSDDSESDATETGAQTGVLG